MAHLIKRNAKLAIEKETTEGVDAGNPAAGSYIKANAEAVEMATEKEELTNDLLGYGLGMAPHKLGLKTGTVSIAMPMAAGSTEGSKSPMSLSLESLLGRERILAAETCSATSTTVLTIPGHSYVAGDTILVKAAGKFEARPVLSVAGDDVTIIPLSLDPSETVAIGATRVYDIIEDGHPSLTITRVFGSDSDALHQKFIGAKCISMSLDNFITGQLADISFGYESFDFLRKNQTPNAPSYTQAERDCVKTAWVWQGGTLLRINEFSLSVTNTLAYITDTKSGKVGSKVIKREVAGSINPYMSDGSAGLAQYNKFDQKLPFSLFITHSNPGSVDGENLNHISFYMPNCLISTIEEGDQEGLMTDVLNFKAYQTDDGQKELKVSIS